MQANIEDYAQAMTRKYMTYEVLYEDTYCKAADNPYGYTQFKSILQEYEIRRRNYYITPEYIIVKDFDDDKTPAAFSAALRFAYNYLFLHPEKTKWESEYLIVLTRVAGE